MVFKGELFFLDSEASYLISSVFTNTKDNVLGTNWHYIAKINIKSIYNHNKLILGL